MAPARRLVCPPCELGSFLVLLVGAGPVDNIRQHGRTTGWQPDPALSHTKMYRRSTDNGTGWLLQSQIASSGFLAKQWMFSPET